MPFSLLPLIRPLIDVVFPPVCLACGRLRVPEELFLCTDCYRSLPRTTHADALYRATEAKLAAGGLIDRLFSPFTFDQGSPLQSLVHELKYGGASGIGLMLGKEIARCMIGEIDPVKVFGVIPVPLHRTKQRERGYNQSVLLCRGIRGVLGIPSLERVLVRTRYTETQTALDAAARAANVRGAFALGLDAPAGLSGATVILVDDVVTTGTTLRECAAVLRGAGAGVLFGATVAVAP